MPNDGTKFVQVSAECFVDLPGQKSVLEANEHRSVFSLPFSDERAVDQQLPRHEGL